MTESRAPEAGMETAFELPHESLVDRRIRQLLARYVEFANAKLTELEGGVLALDVPHEDRTQFGRRSRVLIATTLEALEEHPDAEMAVLGGAFMEQLIDAIRTRGTRHSLGLVAPEFSADSSAASLTIPVRNGTPSEPSVSVARHAVGRLYARVLLRAGAEVEEHLVESGWFDLTTGAPISEDVAECCSSLEKGSTRPSPVEQANGARSAATRPMDELVQHMIGDLQRRLTAQVSRLQDQAERALREELARIDRYYRAMLDEEISKAARRTLVAEHERRAAEERRRHTVRAVVHPLQVIEAELLVQRAEWHISSASGRSAPFTAHRALSGTGAWAMTCSACARAPEGLVLCKDGHVSCDACSRACSVCGEAFCLTHGSASCHVDGQPSCSEHARTCPSCHRVHCESHEGTCSSGDHAACTACLAACALCGKEVCGSHAIMTAAKSALGARRLCEACTVYCEGGRSEPVGKDEVRRCASCERYVCTEHQATCVVDGQVHCSSHLRRTDRSRRLVCEKHRATCAHEPEVIFASDEVRACVSCGMTGCLQHGAACVGDGRFHCRSHLLDLRDVVGAMACEAHRSLCHVDGAVYSLSGTAACPVCARPACSAHSVACGNCGRSVCTSDWVRGERRCLTCTQLSGWDEPSDTAIAAVLEAHGGSMPSVKEWRMARDATHLVVELSLGWTRRTVLAVRHGEGRAERVVGHSALGSSVRR